VAVGPAARTMGVYRPSDKKAWLRHLDYYIELHRWRTGVSGRCSKPWRRAGRGTTPSSSSRPITVTCVDRMDFGLRAFCLRGDHAVPLYVRAPGMTRSGTSTGALATHVDLAATSVRWPVR